MNNNPFWVFSLNHYADSQVEECCLALQDSAYANVNIVLFALWLASLGKRFEYDIVARHARLLYWHEQVIVPLRQARSAIKTDDPQGMADAGLYQRVKQAELDAERVEQDILYQLMPLFKMAGEADQPSAQARLAQANLDEYVQRLTTQTDEMQHWVRCLVAMVFE